MTVSDVESDGPEAEVLFSIILVADGQNVIIVLSAEPVSQERD